MSGRGGMPGWDPSSGKSPDKPDFSLGGTGQSASEYFAEKNRKVAAQKLGAVEVESDVLKGVVVHFGTDTLQKQQKEELVVRLGGEVSGFGERKTHYVVEKMTAAQVRQWRSQTRCFIVTEKWLFDTAERRTRMRESDYQLDALKNPLQHGLGAFGIGAAPPPAAAPPPRHRRRGAAADAAGRRRRLLVVAARRAGGLVLHIDVDAYFVQCHQVPPRNSAAQFCAILPRNSPTAAPSPAPGGGAAQVPARQSARRPAARRHHRRQPFCKGARRAQADGSGGGPQHLLQGRRQARPGPRADGAHRRPRDVRAVPAALGAPRGAVAPPRHRRARRRGRGSARVEPR